MKKTTKELINMFFGKQPKQRFKRVIILLVIIILAIILIQNVGCTITKDGFKFSWQPAANVEVKVDK